MTDQTFLKRLQDKASEQAKLEKRRLLPSALDPLTAFVGNHPWQVLLALSFVTAVVVLAVGKGVQL